MIKQVWKTALLAGSLALVLAGCTPPEPTVFGIPQSQWNTLSPGEKQQVIKGYNQREKINAQNAPINNAIGAASSLIQQNNQYKHMHDNFAPPPMPAMPDFTPPPMPHF
jgi:hypothetical protein